jgi:hypothetical protein
MAIGSWLLVVAVVMARQRATGMTAFSELAQLLSGDVHNGVAPAIRRVSIKSLAEILAQPQPIFWLSLFGSNGFPGLIGLIFEAFSHEIGLLIVAGFPQIRWAASD